MKNTEGKNLITLLRETNPQTAVQIASETIKMVYPKYYPSGAVSFFLDLHNENRVKAAMNTEEVYLLEINNVVVGTGSIRGNEICRLFILPKYQGKGYGSKMMDLLEEKIFKKYEEVKADASFPAESMYFKRGYQIQSYERIETENKDVLCYHTMIKKKR